MSISSSSPIGTLSIVVVILLAALVGVSGLYVQQRAVDYSPRSTSINKQIDGEPGSLGQRYEWRMVTTWPKNFPGIGMTPERFSKLVERMSNGRLVIRVYGSGELVPALGIFDAVSNGSVEMGHGSAYYWKGKIPASPFFTSVPFGMNAQEINAWIHYGGGLELWRTVYKPFGLIPFSGGNTGIQMSGWFKKEIRSIDDLQGLKMRIPGIAGEVFSRAGGTSVTIPGSELYTSMQTGVIDATEWVGPYNDISFGLHEVAEHYYHSGWHEPGAMLEFIVNEDKWNSIPKDLQAIIEVAARAINQDTLDEYTARNATALQNLQSNFGITPKALPREVLQYLNEVALEYYAELAAQDEQFAEIYESYNNFQITVRKYHDISEKEYYITRDYN
ncbi:MAG: TRAP transporter substrate-binding protein DctP [Arenicellaceae bacterium]|nr:TRAP transporter substrate-binding protein DctP [Arenicellaceae bacterium]